MTLARQHHEPDRGRNSLHRHDDLGDHNSLPPCIPVSDRMLIDVENESGARPDDLDLRDPGNEHVLNRHWFHEGRWRDWRLSAHVQPSVAADPTLHRSVFAQDEHEPKDLAQFQPAQPPSRVRAVVAGASNRIPSAGHDYSVFHSSRGGVESRHALDRKPSGDTGGGSLAERACAELPRNDRPHRLAGVAPGPREALCQTQPTLNS